MAKKLPQSHVPYFVTYTGGPHEEIAPDGVRELWGVEFPHGEKVLVTDPKLMTKIKALDDIFDFEQTTLPADYVVPVATMTAPPAPAAEAPKKKGRFGKAIEG